MEDYIIGIDLGSSKVCAALGKVGENGSFQILGVTSVRCSALRKAVVTDSEAATEAIIECIRRLEAETQISTKTILLSFPGGLCDISNAKGIVEISSQKREITEKDVERVSEAAKLISISNDKEIIGFIPDFYIVDGHSNIKNPIGMTGTRLEVSGQIATTETKFVSELLASIKSAGITPTEIIIQPVAQASLLLNKAELSACVTLIDVGDDNVDLSIYKGGNICYTSIIPLGGSNITGDIAQCLKVSLSDAEHIKVKHGDVKIEPGYEFEDIKVNSSYTGLNSITKDILVEIIGARTEEILNFISEELNLSGYYNEIDVVVITGGGISMFKNIDQLSREILNKSVRIAVPEFEGASKATSTTAISIIKYKMDSYKLKNNVAVNETIKTKRSSKNVRSKKFGWKIKEILEEFF